MAKWHAMLEYIQFPLKVLFFATVLLGIGNSIINPNAIQRRFFDSNISATCIFSDTDKKI